MKVQHAFSTRLLSSSRFSAFGPRNQAAVAGQISCASSPSTTVVTSFFTACLIITCCTAVLNFFRTGL